MYQCFPLKFFRLEVPKNFVRESSCVSLVSGTEKFNVYEGNITFFYRNSVVSQYRKTS